MKPRVAVIAVLVLAIILTAVVLVRRHKEFLYAGTIEATEVTVSSRLSAVIERFDPREGTTVRQNTLLVKLSVSDIDVAAVQAEREYARGLKLKTAGSITDDMLDKLRANRDAYRVKLDWSVITAPTDGTILSRYHEPGEMVSPGTKLLTMADLTRVWEYVYVPQPMLAKLSVGMPVKGYLPELNMREVDGKIIKINDEAEFTPKNVQTRSERARLVYGVKIEFVNPDRLLKPGMTVEVKLPETDK